jgi:ADP-ribose pyrophosphatase YjhB (NUDIX family)
MEDKILKRFSRYEKLKFNDLKEEVPSNKLSYHLKKLIQENLLEKKQDHYFLTDKGEEKLCYLQDKGSLKQPIHDVFLLPFKDGKYIIQKRTKRPFLNTYIPIGARIRKGESIFETAEKKLKKDTCMTGDLHFKGIIDVKTFKQNKLFLHHILNVFLIDNLQGDLTPSTPKGENFWMTEKEYYNQKNNLTAAKEHFEIAKQPHFTLLELEQHLNEKGKFVKSKIIRKVEI